MMEKQCGSEEAIHKRGVNWRMMADKLGRDKPSKGRCLGRDKPRGRLRKDALDETNQGED